MVDNARRKYNLPFVETYQVAGLAALGDPTRRAIFELVAQRPHLDHFWDQALAAFKATAEQPPSKEHA
jgi:DNA-binding transcriptional ArsR family regulator